MINYELNYHDTASEKVLLIHGLFGDKNNLNNLKKTLLPQFNVMTIDLPDHGQSSHVKHWQFDTVIDDIYALLAQQNFIPCSIVGHSLGGKVAMAMALSRPDDIKKVVVADIAPVAYPPRHDAVFNALEAVERAKVSDRKQAVEIMNTMLNEPGVGQFLLKSFKRKSDAWKWQFNLTELFNGPVLFIKGEQSDYIEPTHQAAILNHFPNASFKVISNTGHWLHAEKPEVFNRLVLRMLNTQSA
jgi:esterase